MTFQRLLLIFVFFLQALTMVFPRESLASEMLKLVDRIELNGVRVLSQKQLEDLLKVTPGEILKETDLAESRSNLLIAYQRHGYREARVAVSLVKKKNSQGNFENVVQFDVAEGSPTLIRSIYFNLLQGQEEQLIKHTEKYHEKILRPLIPLSEGSVFDQEKIFEGLRIIQDFLIKEGYVGIKILPVKTHVADKKDISPSEKEKGYWVNLEVPITLGERVDFRFRGNSFLTKGQLEDFIKEQRTLGLGVDYIQVIKKKILEEYQSFGFNRIQIETFPVENTKEGKAINGFDRMVTYAITEGPRVKIRSINFDGNTVFPNDKLKEVFFQKGSKQLQNRIFVIKDVENAANLVVEFMKEKGYLAAKVVHVSVVAPPLPRSQVSGSVVDVVVYLYEGEQSVIQSFQVHGAKAIPSEEIQKTLKVEVKKPVNLFAFEEGLEALKKLYKDRGYLEFQILNEGSDQLVIYSSDQRFIDIQLIIEEGAQYKVSGIQIEGLVKTKEFVVFREIQFKDEDVLKQTLLVETEQRLRRLGIFSQVIVRTLNDTERPGYKAVKIILEEADRGSLTWGPGVRNDLGVRLFSQFSYANLWGENHAASVSVSVNRRFYNYHFVETQAQITYSWPWFALPGITFRPSILIGKIQYLNFAADNLTLSTLWEKTLIDDPKLIASFTYSLEKIRQFNAPLPTASSPINDNQQLQIGSVTPRLTLDLRDNPLLPSSGFYFTSWADFAAPVFGTQADPRLLFYRAQFRGDYHLPVLTDVGLYFSFRTGFEKNLMSANANSQGASDIPLIKQFALGGIGSLRGYQEQQLNVQNQGINQSLSYVNYRTELVLPFIGALKVALFLDAANLLVNQYHFGEFLYGSGLGFRYQTPVGAVNLDWGFKLNPPPGADASVVHFSLGVI